MDEAEDNDFHPYTHRWWERDIEEFQKELHDAKRDGESGRGRKTVGSAGINGSM
jgi:hypothetical protein